VARPSDLVMVHELSAGVDARRTAGLETGATFRA